MTGKDTAHGRGHKAPRAFRLDDPNVVLAPRGVEAEAARGGTVITETADPDAFDAPVSAAPPPRRAGIGWASLLFSALFGLFTLWLVTSVEAYVSELLVRQPALGWLALALAALAVLSMLALAARELRGVWRARAVAALRDRAAATLASDDREEGRAVLAALDDLYAARAETARARGRLAETRDDIIDGADLVRLAERELMETLDREARMAVAGAARRVSLVTAISPRAAIDLIFVAAQALRLVRRVSEIYGGRPGMLGFLRLLRAVGGHLAVTGGVAAGDSLVQQVLGHGVAARLSARLGEGVLNGLLTARVGLSAIAVCRPLPFAALKPPGVGDVAGFLLDREGPAKPAG
ncbi:TIGR01620 family protein [Alsobacter sp. SYSU M60028]|uniref:TIGR01620 family protein n=1 Tax=Alsobacter ponti TaxID=2962936 RepID=A0ABT1L771_9HYPH|nr:TIGR01620 family protein [Alsobacter ponti]MCP8937302.1 TIGR01620 family protein [Alsobacter ponti]